MIAAKGGNEYEEIGSTYRPRDLQKKWLDGGMTNGPVPSTPPSASASPSHSWEEYKLYFETTEKVIDRRIALNSWNYGVCSAMLIASGLLANWLSLKEEMRFTLLVAIAMISGIGIILSRLWYRQVKDLKLLNNAKFEVLEAMAPLIRFSDGSVSFEAFKKEWSILSRKGAIAKKWGLRVKVLKSSGAEFLLPWSFGIVFALILVLSVAIAWSNQDQLRIGALKLPVVENCEKCKK